MDVLNFITEYPELEGDKLRFAYKLYHLEEFYSERYTDSASSGSLFTNLLKHQKVVARFLVGSTPYNGLLVAHEVGTGKTCAAIAVAEANRANIGRVYFVSPSKELLPQQKRELSTCFPGLYSEGKGKDKKKIYKWTTQYVLAKEISNLTDAQIYNQYSNSVVIVDEAHELVPSTKARTGAELRGLVDPDGDLPALQTQDRELREYLKSSQREKASREEIDQTREELERVGNAIAALEEKQDTSVDRQVQYTRLFSIPADIKVVLLTGTPMTNFAREFPPLLRLLDMDRYWSLPPPKVARTNWDDLSAPDIDKREAEIAEQIRGRVSFFRRSQLGTARSFEPGLIPISPGTDCAAVDCPPLWETSVAAPDATILKPIRGAPSGRVDPVLNGWIYPPVEKRDSIEQRVKSRMKGTELYTCIMSRLHTDEYTPYWLKGTFPPRSRPSVSEGLPESFTKASRDSFELLAEYASLIVVPTGSPDAVKYLVGRELTVWMDGKATRGNAQNETRLKNWFRHPGRVVGQPDMRIDVRDYQRRLQVLYAYCPKYAVSVERILRAHSEHKKVFVYGRLVQGGAVRTFADLLETFHYEDWTYTQVDTLGQRGEAVRSRKAVRAFPKTRGKRFILLTGSTPVNVAAVLRLYNDPRNARGEYIQVVVGSARIKQGFNIKDVQEMHVLAPPWNYSNLDQAMGRVVREGSHKVIDRLLAEEDPPRPPASVRVCLFTAVPSYWGRSSLDLEAWEEKQKPGDRSVQEGIAKALANCNSADLKKYHDLELKDRAVKRMERIIKMNAIDCPLFYARNRVKGEEKKRACEYEDSCSYICSGMTEHEMAMEVSGYMPGVVGAVPASEISAANFDKLYSRGEVEHAKERIKDAFSTTRMLGPPYIDRLGTFIGLKALSEIVSGNAVVYGPSGFPNYVKEEDGRYFLSRTPQDSPGEVLTASRPFALLKDYSMEAIDLLSNKLSSTLVCGDITKLPALIDLEVPETQEYLLETAFVERLQGGLTEDQEMRVGIILDKLGKYIRNSADGSKVYSSLLAEECYRSLTLEDVGKEGVDLDRRWCGRIVPWPTPIYWKDDEKPEVDSGSLRDLFVKAITWPSSAPDEVKSQLPKWMLERGFPSFWIGSGPLGDDWESSKYHEIRWIYRGETGIETALKPQDAGVWIKKGRKFERSWKKDGPPKKTTVLGLCKEEDGEWPRSRAKLATAHGLDPLQLCVPADARISGEGRAIKTMKPGVARSLREWLDQVWEGRPHPQNSQPISAKNPYWTATPSRGKGGSRPSRVSYVVAGNKALAQELMKLGLWEPESQDVTRAIVQQIGLELSGLPEDALPYK